MKKLVIFYSLEGNTKLVAETIAEVIGAGILELRPKKEIPKSQKLTKYFWGGKQILFKERPTLKKFDKNPDDYDIIFIGTPVWVKTYAPAIRSFLENQKLKNKKIALFCTHEEDKGGIFEKMKKSLNKNKFIGEKDFYKVFKNKEKSISKAREWAMLLDNSIIER